MKWEKYKYLFFVNEEDKMRYAKWEEDIKEKSNEIKCISNKVF